MPEILMQRTFPRVVLVYSPFQRRTGLSLIGREKYFSAFVQIGRFRTETGIIILSIDLLGQTQGALCFIHKHLMQAGFSVYRFSRLILRTGWQDAAYVSNFMLRPALYSWNAYCLFRQEIVGKIPEVMNAISSSPRYQMQLLFARIHALGASLKSKLRRKQVN
jgi:hypothetical protein